MTIFVMAGSWYNGRIQKFILQSCSDPFFYSVYLFGKEGRVIEQQEIIDRILQGDQAAFRVLVDLYSKHVFQVAYSVLHDVKEAEDAAQEAFLQVYKSLPQYRSQGFKTWITRIALHKAIDAKRKKARRREDQTSDEQSLERIAATEEDPLFALLDKEKKELLYQRLGQLPDNHREVLMAFYLQHKNYEEIAEELGVTVKTVESKLYRARLQARSKWRKEEWK